MAKTASKKPIAKKTSKKTVGAKKGAKATTSKKPVVKEVPAKKNSSSKAVTLSKLYKFNLFSAAANLVFAILSVLFMAKNSVEITMPYFTKDELASTGGATVLGPAYKTLATIEIRYILAVIFVISAIFSLLLATKLRQKYESGVKKSVSAARWGFMGISLGLSLIFVSLLGGIQSEDTLKLVGVLVFIAAILAVFTEKENQNTKKRYHIFYLGMFAGVVAFLPLLSSLISTTLYGVESFRWYVYALSAFGLVGFISIGWSHYRHIRDGISTSGYLQLEGKYVSTDFLIKLGTFAIVIAALHK